VKIVAEIHIRITVKMLGCDAVYQQVLSVYQYVEECASSLKSEQQALSKHR
jgi:hypothetical protein